MERQNKTNKKNGIIKKKWYRKWKRCHQGGRSEVWDMSIFILMLVIRKSCTSSLISCNPFPDTCEDSWWKVWNFNLCHSMRLLPVTSRVTFCISSSVLTFSSTHPHGYKTSLGFAWAPVRAVPSLQPIWILLEMPVLWNALAGRAGWNLAWFNFMLI